MSEQSWDAIFVGAGITSLACAALLVKQRPELKLLVVDKHIVAGGYATIFKRPKEEAMFDCSLHKLSGMGEGGNLHRIFESLGLYEELELKYPDDYFCAYKDKNGKPFENCEHGMAAQLREMFPREEASINTFFEQVATYGRNGYYQFQMMDGSFEPDIEQLRFAHKNLKNITVEQALNDMFEDPYLIEILAAPGIYVGGYPEDLGYLYYLHVVFATLNKGNAYVVGSSQNLSNTLAARIEQAGGKVLLSTPVQQVLVDEDCKAVGIRTKKQNYYAKQVFINTSPHYALDNLFDESIDLTDPKNKIASLKPARSTTTVYLVTDVPPEQLGLVHTESMIFSPDPKQASVLRKAAESSGYDGEKSELAFWENSPMEVTNYHLLDANGGRVVCLNVLDSIEHWPARRSQPYREKKKRAADVLLSRLYEQVPDLQGHVTYQEVSSPHTYVRFTNNTAGSGYGAMVSTDLSGHVFHHRFPVKGIDFVSAWVAGPSYEAAFGYAEMKAKKWLAA